MTDTHLRIGAAQGTGWSITPVSPLTCLLPAIILSLLTIAATSWFLPEAGDDAILQSGLVAGTIVMTVVAVTAVVVHRHTAHN